jgi:thioredoxin reductase (NADPH)
MSPDRPIIYVVDDEQEALDQVASELVKRYGTDYAIEVNTSASQALHELEIMRKEDTRVAIVLADQWMPEMTGVEFLARARAIYPTSKRCLILDAGDPAMREPIIQATASGDVDYYLPRPTISRYEPFHRTVAEFLDEWSRFEGEQAPFVTVVGESTAPRCHRLEDLFHRSTIPFVFHEYTSAEGRNFLAGAGLTVKDLPAVQTPDGNVLAAPTDIELAEALGGRSPIEGEFDVTIVGSGPAGLAAAVYASSEGLRVLVLDREIMGGQAGTSSNIRNYLGFPRGVSGRELAERAFQQAWLFGTNFQLFREVDVLKHNGGIEVSMTDGTTVQTRAVVLATGADYRQLDAPGINELLGAGVFFGAPAVEGPAMRNESVVVVGGGNSAGQAAVHLSRYAKKVTMLVWEPRISDNMSSYLIKEIDSSRNIEYRLNREVLECKGRGRFERIVSVDRNGGEREEHEGRAVFFLIGVAPRTEWLPAELLRDPKGFIYTGSDVPEAGAAAARERLPFETSMPGVFAAGDARHGSAKRVASAVGEGSIVVEQLHRYLAAHRET